MTTLFLDSKVLVSPILEVSAQAILAGVLESQQELAAWENWAVGDYTIEKAQQFVEDCARTWEDKTSVTFALLDPSSQKFIGTSTVRLAHRENSFANLGYWVHSGRTKQGIATTAASAVATYAFQQLGYTRLEIVAQAKNLASRRVAEKVGATFECIARNRLIYLGEPRDAAMYSLIPDDIRG